MTQVAEWASKVLPHLGPEAGVQECILEPGEVPRFFASTSSSLSFCSCGSQLEFEAIMLHTLNVIATQVIKMYLPVSHSFFSILSGAVFSKRLAPRYPQFEPIHCLCVDFSYRRIELEANRFTHLACEMRSIVILIVSS